MCEREGCGRKRRKQERGYGVRYCTEMYGENCTAPKRATGSGAGHEAQHEKRKRTYIQPKRATRSTVATHRVR